MRGLYFKIEYISMDILKIASLLDDSGDYELSDKLFKIAQKNVVQQGVMNAVGGGQSTKSTYDHGKAAVDIVSFLTKYFKKYIPIFIQTLSTVKSSLHKFENIPAIDNILGALDLGSFIEDTLDFLNKVNTMGFINYYETDPKGVTQFFISFISTINQLAGYIPIFAPMKIQLQTIDASMNALNTMVTISDMAGTYMGTTNTSLTNFSSPNQQKETQKRIPATLNTNAGATNFEDDTLTGEVFNVLLDYVNKRGMIKTLVDKHIPDWDPKKPEKMAQVQSYITQNKLPRKDQKYLKSSYKNQQELQERIRKFEYDNSPTGPESYLWDRMVSTVGKGLQRNIINPVKNTLNTVVRNYNNSIPKGSNTGYINPIEVRDYRMQR